MALHIVGSPGPGRRRASQHPVPQPIRPLNLPHLALWLALWALIAFALYRNSTSSFVSWYATIVWTMPLGVAAMGLAGSVVSRRLIKEELAQPDPGVVHDPIHVTLITKGDNNVLGALTRAAESLPLFVERFPNFTGYIVTDHGAEAMEAMKDLCRRLGLTLIVTPPKDEWSTPNRTKFKARAAVYSHMKRVENMGGKTKIPRDHWTYQLDDDTAVMADTVTSLALAVKENRGPNGKQLLQGNLVYPRRFSTSWFNWLADAIRPGDDLGRFALTTGRGTPLNGCHGENLLVKTRVIQEIGWDFGPGEIVEDSRFALTFAQRYPGRSGWMTARCYGASPVNAADFVIQRIRWAEGIERLAFKRGQGIALRNRLMIMHNMIVWGFGLFQPALVVLGISWLVKDYHITPVVPVLGGLWVLSMAYTCWIYVSGLKANSLASGWKRIRVRDFVGVLVFLPLFSFMEGLGGTIGVCKYFLKYMPSFPVIGKPS